MDASSPMKHRLLAVDGQRCGLLLRRAKRVMDFQYIKPPILRFHIQIAHKMTVLPPTLRRATPLSKRLILFASLHSQSHSGAMPEEIEVKIKLPDSDSHRRITTILSPFQTATHFQENLFFDSPGGALSSRRAALRLRFYDSDRRSVLSLKASPAISAGVSRAEELELDVEPLAARACAAEPAALRRLSGLRSEPNTVIERVRELLGSPEEDFSGWICLGGFRNVRNVFDWKGLKLEVDETLFDFGRSYEIECESEKVEEAKRMIEELLDENGIRFSYSEVSKFAAFRAGKMGL